MPADQDLPSMLRLRRVSVGLTQEELAEKAGISARTVSDVERGIRTSVYPDTARRLADGLGLQGEDRARFERSARGRRGPPIDPPSRGGPTAGASGEIPTPPSRLIGRSSDVDAVRDRLRSGARLVTVTGPGGIGKTRLAIEVATLERADAGEDVTFLSLAGTTDASLFAPMLAHALGQRQPREPLEQAVRDHLRDRRALIVLDTLEHLPGAIPFIGDMLAAGPGVRI